MSKTTEVFLLSKKRPPLGSSIIINGHECCNGNNLFHYKGMVWSEGRNSKPQHKVECVACKEENTLVAGGILWTFPL